MLDRSSARPYRVGMRLSRTKIAGCTIAVGALTHAAALTWYAHHIRATSGAALTVYGDVADLLDVLSAGLIGYTIVLLIMAVVFGRGAAIRWTTFGLICASVVLAENLIRPGGAPLR
jgi:mannose/fructose/N-acetylgalactosamine-specific phosphotransferase system component IID